MDDRLRIQNHLISLAKAFEFETVAYDKVSGEARKSGEKIKPSTCLCNETASNFESDGRHGRQEARKRNGWTFQLILGFNAEVTLEPFEKSVTEPVARIPSDVSRAYGNVAIRLLRTEADHPVQQQPSSGTKATLTFEVDPPRI